MAITDRFWRTSIVPWENLCKHLNHSRSKLTFAKVVTWMRDLFIAFGIWPFFPGDLITVHEEGKLASKSFLLCRKMTAQLWVPCWGTHAEIYINHTLETVFTTYWGSGADQAMGVRSDFELTTFNGAQADYALRGIFRPSPVLTMNKEKTTKQFVVKNAIPVPGSKCCSLRKLLLTRPSAD